MDYFPTVKIAPDMHLGNNVFLAFSTFLSLLFSDYNHLQIKGIFSYAQDFCVTQLITTDIIFICSFILSALTPNIQTSMSPWTIQMAWLSLVFLSRYFILANVTRLDLVASLSVQPTYKIKKSTRKEELIPVTVTVPNWHLGIRIIYVKDWA